MPRTMPRRKTIGSSFGRAAREEPPSLASQTTSPAVIPAIASAAVARRAGFEKNTSVSWYSGLEISNYAGVNRLAAAAALATFVIVGIVIAVTSATGGGGGSSSTTTVVQTTTTTEATQATTTTTTPAKSTSIPLTGAGAYDPEGDRHE